GAGAVATATRIRAANLPAQIPDRGQARRRAAVCEITDQPRTPAVKSTTSGLINTPAMIIDHWARIEVLPTAGVPGRTHNVRWSRRVGLRRAAADQVNWTINRRIDNCMPSQNRNPRPIVADNAPSSPHSSFVG